MIPSGELELGRMYRSDDGAFALYRVFIGIPAMSDFVIPHNLGFVPKQIHVVSSEGRSMRCFLKVTSGKAVKDIHKATVQFTDTSAICTLRIE